MPVDNLKLNDVISWALWEKFSNSPVVGWMQEMRHTILPNEVIDPQRMEEMKKIELSERLNEEETGIEIRKIFKEVFEEYASKETNTEAESEEATTAESRQSETLIQVSRVFEDLVQRIGSDNKAKETQTTVGLFN